MEQTPIISFIIPAYNASATLFDCVESIVKSINALCYEVIIVDDCSTDLPSLQIISDYSKIHSNINIIHNEKNFRCGWCRNIGIQAARGKYIWFVDQDDYIADNCLVHLLKICNDGNLDILSFDYRNVSDDGYYDAKHNLILKSSPILTGLDYIQQCCNGDFWTSQYDANVWHSLFRREFLLANEILSPKISYCEDLIVALKAVVIAQKVQSITDDYYRYRNNPQSVLNTEVGKKGRTVFDASLFAGTQVFNMSHLVSQEYKDLKQAIADGGIWRMNSFTKRIFKLPKFEIYLFYEQVRLHPEVINDAMPFLRRINRLIIRHPYIVITFASLLKVVYKSKWM